ncbi:hypothetical protein [Streptomyces winkii]|uniref:hypothetical protein n=1 Tax=Streptomyces winkii TaxID=3051178 RepID=UPI0028D858B6|nr:hypothetical protein [Streptomyces sp. DSM 40971]
MDERLLGELRALGKQAAEAQRIFSEIQDRIPAGATGSDVRGVVEVRIGADGLPERIAVSRDWSRRRQPDEIGTAVMEAAEAAASELMSAWSSGLFESDWEARAARLDGRDEPSAASTDEGGPEPRYVFARSVDEIAEEAISALDRAIDAPALPDPRVTGADRSRRISLTLGGGTFQGCTVDAAWAGKQSAIGLNTAFEEALEDARAALRQAEGSAAAAGEAQHLSSLVDEALSVLKDPRRLAGD